MGKGTVTATGENYEGKCSTHGQPLSKSGADFAETVRNLGGDPENPFSFFKESEKIYAARREELKEIVARRRAQFKKWAEENQGQALILKSYIDGVVPQIDYNAIVHKANIATRTASANVLAELSAKVGNMIVASADLANSDKTDGFLRHTHALAPGDFTGAFLHAGVSELTMAVIMNGIVLHGGLFAACGTFFVFSDYMKPALRMSALMELPVKYIWSHDAFRVGEDGPTHQPIEQEAQLRLMEQIRNFSGKPSILVLRPADAAETSVAYKMAMENTGSPSALILSRQDVHDLPAPEGMSRIEAAQGAIKGAYTVMSSENPDVILVANGSEVSLACQAAALLEADLIRVNVVSAPSIGLFNEQPEQYRSSVLIPGVPQFGITAGLPQSIRMMDGFNGKVFGLEHFGASAPYSVLDEKFGFTPRNIYVTVKQYLGKGAPEIFGESEY